jgi:hypothetical protein
MTSREKRRFREKFAAQVEQERNGAPIPGEIAELMTKPKLPDALYQVVVTVAETGVLLPVGPAMMRDACGMFAEAVNRQVAMGRERVWTNAAVVPLTPISTGVH